MRYAEILLDEAREELGRADNKISVLLASAGLASSIVAAAIAAGRWRPVALPAWPQVIWWTGAAAAMMGIVTLAAALTPRMNHVGPASTMRYFGHAAQLTSAAEVLEVLGRVSDHLLERIADQLLIISRLVVLKYALIRLALVLFGVALL
ncbi:MAG TPA: Pycsar system effector family protein, partial [Streptosporangiaceae bacterium]|nr:Pycsar system effector family protein [Streptosporangiaceae bacterium]